MKQTILLIEPNATLARIYQQFLKKAGFLVVWCAHAQDAILAADKQKPALVILELQLAGHGGIEFLHEFRSYPEWQTVPVIIHTIVPPPSVGLSAENRRLLGIADILYKPATKLRQLASAVRSALETQLA